MKWIKTLLITVTSLSILNVWFFRFGNATRYRGGDATSLLEEFLVYGFSENFMYFIGALKIFASLALLVGIFYNKLILPAASVIAVLMLGAISVHFKVQDEWIKFFPATLFFVFSIAIIVLELQRKRNA